MALGANRDSDETQAGSDEHRSDKRVQKEQSDNRYSYGPAIGATGLTVDDADQKDPVNLAEHQVMRGGEELHG